MTDERDPIALAAEAERLKQFMEEEAAKPTTTKDGKKTPRQLQADRAAQIAIEQVTQRIVLAKVAQSETDA